MPPPMSRVAITYVEDWQFGDPTGHGPRAAVRLFALLGRAEDLAEDPTAVLCGWPVADLLEIAKLTGGHIVNTPNIWGADTSDEWTRLVIGVLQEWALALDGWGDTPVEMRLPDPAYRWKGHTPSMDEIDSLLRDIDAFVGREWANWGKARGFEAGTEFVRLAPEQRLALMQDLDRALEQYDQDRAAL